MENYVIKRNGKYQPFESYKVKDVIEKSFQSVSVVVDESVFESVSIQLKNKEVWAVEEIQDIIEKKLFDKN
ncbi:MAG: ATP cone domain-containing protein, partial [Flavobacterium sp.]